MSSLMFSVPTTAHSEHHAGRSALATLGDRGLRLGRLLLATAFFSFTARQLLAEETPSSATPQATLSATSSAHEHFVQTIKPLLAKKCFGCHNAEDAEGELDLTSREAMMRGGASGDPAVVAGDASRSPLHDAVTWEGDYQMPPKERNRLTRDEVTLLRDWVNAGALWPSEKEILALEADAKWSYKPEDLWAFRPLISPEVPTVEGVSHPIDAFIKARLEKEGLAPAPRADRLTLIRRATFDLTGLPPTPEEIEAFLNDTSEDAYEKLLDRLLESPRYGEQWGRHWLDVARYADTAGFANDWERPGAWRYRDYVIRSFNEDKPYDRFVLEQIAGDELDPSDPDCQIATGFLRMGPWEHTGMSVAAVTRQLFLDDVTNSVGQSFLGLGLGCAKCHDHKFDPIPQRDYYRMQAVFAPVQFDDKNVPFQAHENTSHVEQERERIARLKAEVNRKLAPINATRAKAVEAHLAEKGVTKEKDLPRDERPDRNYGLTPTQMGLKKVYNKWNQVYAKSLQTYQPIAFSVRNGPFSGYRNHPGQKMKQREQGPVMAVFVLAGGALESPGEKVGPGVLSTIPASAEGPAQEGSATIGATMKGRRLDFARWIASRDNPLTPRVMVNRIWQYHFGAGIAANANNLGKMGKKPSHPELLDWLAGEFLARGWSVKEMHRLIMTSEAYRRGSEHPDPEKLAKVDPDNTLLAAFTPRRLSAEELRDGILSIAGLLSMEMGGPGVHADLHREVALQPRHIMGTVAPSYQAAPDPRQRNRRTIYAAKIRTLGDPFLEVFNRPTADVSCERRDISTVTPQVFALFNGELSHEWALAMACRLCEEARQPKERVTRAFRLCFGRVPDEGELSWCLEHVRAMRARHEKELRPTRSPQKEVTRSSQEELTGELFTFTEPLDRASRYEPNVAPEKKTPETLAWADLCLVLLNANEFVYVY
ncbi:Planctomycete cytochrome C [Planctomycetes bacterium Pan216]|uniref:Planctomycete cytochrome C n=1 Tax=Kolteria novifilia TaxID=2527975 RepID=A0A518B000_9BACT|nr:Planctomycete cytochrome C [Planctomycetes bacterium Pan216]